MNVDDCWHISVTGKDAKHYVHKYLFTWSLAHQDVMFLSKQVLQFKSMCGKITVQHCGIPSRLLLMSSSLTRATLN